MKKLKILILIFNLLILSINCIPIMNCNDSKQCNNLKNCKKSFIDIFTNSPSLSSSSPSSLPQYMNNNNNSNIGKMIIDKEKKTIIFQASYDNESVYRILSIPTKGGSSTINNVNTIAKLSKNITNNFFISYKNQNEFFIYYENCLKKVSNFILDSNCFYSNNNNNITDNNNDIYSITFDDQGIFGYYYSPIYSSIIQYPTNKILYKGGNGTNQIRILDKLIFFKIGHNIYFGDLNNLFINSTNNNNNITNNFNQSSINNNNNIKNVLQLPIFYSNKNMYEFDISSSHFYYSDWFEKRIYRYPIRNGIIDQTFKQMIFYYLPISFHYFNNYLYLSFPNIYSINLNSKNVEFQLTDHFIQSNYYCIDK
ncbi:hypothetical protein DDB_G0276509 [Dictyostelium discoideum AX4]|uniref:Uncharacterized protein n=1 Tax=Dictyostelium discoideum TaxID=44689 RepID=Q86HV5_DICDI|nr:hypothetical protein DDB_G0276509 [Dictyostelium discoideum AX4]EAL69208.2 hypothetical protein DDB_G0276509 [Dictyostelium discoideum AX4]|eukprot:XP_643139.2 hypothetical protein DDB_G0276509 [Dictyostelium discoideum AX4]